MVLRPRSETGYALHLDGIARRSVARGAQPPSYLEQQLVTVIVAQQGKPAQVLLELINAGLGSLQLAIDAVGDDVGRLVSAGETRLGTVGAGRLLAAAADLLAAADQARDSISAGGFAPSFHRGWRECLGVETPLRASRGNLKSEHDTG